ncbi:MAG TPA: DUF357 domain-containing protein [Candidatus Thermoplasmatota archaeon]|nr:DUF357 domain-containing protein [Candidatus Thermoplasmatota archaeon]
MDGDREITDGKVAKYLDLTARALEKLKLAPPAPSHLRDVADDFLTMARSYHADARSFAARGDLVNAFACVNYAHGWLDAGARLGLWDVGGDDVLFTLSK